MEPIQFVSGVRRSVALHEMADALHRACYPMNGVCLQQVVNRSLARRIDRNDGDATSRGRETRRQP